MTPDEFLSLPAPVALRILLDCLDEETIRALREKPKPKLPLPPKFDRSIFRSEGIMWASEVDLSGLRYWHNKYRTSAESGGKYAESDRKNATEIERWIKWRECFPDAIWLGERDHAAVTAKPPSSHPTVYARGNVRPKARPDTHPEEEIDPNTF